MTETMSEERDGMSLGGASFSGTALADLHLQHLHNNTPLILIEFSPEATAETIDWLLGKITKVESLGGADLVGKVIGQTKAAGAVLVVGATSERLLLEADEELLFRHKPFCCSHELKPSTSNPRHPSESEGLCGMLSSAEAIILVQRILSRLTVGEEEDVYGFSALPGDPIMDSLRRRGIIVDSYPLHNAPQLVHLRQTFRDTWGGLKSFTQTNQGHLLEEIKGYFGEGAAHYFGFLGSLINALFLKSLLAVVFYNIHQLQCRSLIFSLSNVIWSELFLQRWKQRSKSLEADWKGPKEPQPSNCPSDSQGLSPKTTGLSEQQTGNTPVKKCWSRFQQSTLFLVSMFLLSSVVFLVYFRLEAIIWNSSYKKQISTMAQTLDYLPDIALTIAVEAVDHTALWLAHSLYAKPVYQGSRARPYQPFLPELVIVSIYNRFAIHVYRALIQQDLIALHHHLTVQLVTQTALHLLTGGLLPYLQWKRTGKLSSHSQMERDLPFLKHMQDQISRSTRNTIETKGHINILITYCHVMLFSGIYPLCALWCLLGAVARSHIYFWQMCVFFCRPFPQATSEMKHTWHRLFDVVGVLSTVVNAMLLSTSSDFPLILSGLSQWGTVKVMLGLHLWLIGLKMAAMSVASCIFSSSDPQTEQPRLHHLRRYRPQCQ